MVEGLNGHDMDNSTVKRKLAAIFYADVAGYSRLTGADEIGTHRKLSESLDLFISAIESHGGRTVHFAGDAILAVFDSVLDATSAAIKGQRELGIRNKDVPEDERLLFRVGINLGDVIVDRNDIFGDGVNVAARLESLAEPGGICISGMVERQVRGKLDVGFEDMGLQQVKNISDAVYTYKVLLDPADAGVQRAQRETKRAMNWKALSMAGAAAAVILGVIAVWQLGVPALEKQQAAKPASTTQTVSTSEKPTVAILPFSNLSQEAGTEHLADGIAEDVITALSQVPGLAVISRNSTFSYKGQNVTPTHVSEKLGARYVLEGSFRKAGERVRVSARLIDTSTNLTLWAEQLDREFSDVFMLQDEIAGAIVRNLSLRLANAERLRVSSKRPQNVQAYDYVLQARQLTFTRGRESRAQAKKLLDKALELDPNYAQAFAALAWVHAFDSRIGRPEQREQALSQALEAATKAYELDKGDYFTNWTLGLVNSHLRNDAKAFEYFEKALSLNPNAAEIYTHMVRNHLRKNDKRAALDAARTAIRLNPVHPPHYKTTLATALFAAGQYDNAVESVEAAIAGGATGPRARILLALTYAKLNRETATKLAVSEIKAKFPRLNVRRVMRNADFIPVEERAFYATALRDAGLPFNPPDGNGERPPSVGVTN